MEKLNENYMLAVGKYYLPQNQGSLNDEALQSFIAQVFES